jgi:multidrug efflux pump subunit AcrA (membrane-fusion protein)
LAVLILPRTLSSPGTFVMRPAITLVATAPASGIVGEVLVAEGDRVSAGTPLLRLVDRELEHDLLEALRLADSLSLAETAARPGGYASGARLAPRGRTRASSGSSRLRERREPALSALSVGSPAPGGPRPEAGLRVPPDTSAARSSSSFDEPTMAGP